MRSVDDDVDAINLEPAVSGDDNVSSKHDSDGETSCGRESSRGRGRIRGQPRDRSGKTGGDHGKGRGCGGNVAPACQGSLQPFQQCQQMGKSNPCKAPMIEREIVFLQFETVAIDLVGQFENGRGGYRHISVWHPNGQKLYP